MKRKEMEKKEEMEREKHPENAKIEIQNKRVKAVQGSEE